jgi:hypothetical protein
VYSNDCKYWQCPAKIKDIMTYDPNDRLFNFYHGRCMIERYFFPAVSLNEYLSKPVVQRDVVTILVKVRPRNEVLGADKTRI